MRERVELQTSDSVKIIGTYQNGGHKKAAILLHMMPATKESWDAFMNALDSVGFASIAIDERGHGESTMNGTLDYKTFNETQQQAKILDVDSAFKFLIDRGFSESNIILVGASIGANLSIQFLANHPLSPLAIALSPGLNYRGVETDESITKLHNGQRVVLVASDDDDRDSAESCRKLHALNPAQTTLIEKTNLGHGTTMFEKDPLLMNEILDELHELR